MNSRQVKVVLVYVLTIVALAVVVVSISQQRPWSNPQETLIHDIDHNRQMLGEVTLCVTDLIDNVTRLAGVMDVMLDHFEECESYKEDKNGQSNSQVRNRRLQPGGE